MNLANPVTIQPPSITLQDGKVRTFQPITLSKLDVVLIDNSGDKHVIARVQPCPFPLVLWEDTAYDAAGDYTQAQAEARILELLGEDIKSGLEALFLPPTSSKSK